MFEIKNINKDKGIFFIGIGGISMSALAVILQNDGYSVSGSDFRESETVLDLREKGIDVVIGHKAESVEGAGLIVYTAAVKDDNPELCRARELGIPAIDRATLLGAMMKDYTYPVAVSGTHGKTTATSMLSHVLCEAEKNPTILVGGVLPLIGGNFRDGGKDYFVTEACEYCASFLKFYPLYTIILNIEEDHLDYFKDIDHIVNCFSEFVEKTPKSGAVIANFDDENVKKTLKNNPAATVSYAINDKGADYTAENISFNDAGLPSFDVVEKGSKITRVTLSVPGIHNVSNSLAVFAVSRLLGVKIEDIADGLASFKGANRRFEYKGSVCGAKVYDDYAHHPTEIKATLAAAKATGASRVRCVFQPHTYTRTRALMEEFIKSFKDCDDLIITDIFAAREKDTGLVHAKDLADKIPGAKYMKDFKDIEEYFIKTAQEGDIIFTMGAGDVYKIAQNIVE